MLAALVASTAGQRASHLASGLGALLLVALGAAVIYAVYYGVSSAIEYIIDRPRLHAAILLGGALLLVVGYIGAVALMMIAGGSAVGVAIALWLMGGSQPRRGY